MAMLYSIVRALVAMLCVSAGSASMVSKCMKVLTNKEFHTPCSSLDSNHVKPCLVKTEQDADVLIGAKIIGGGTQIPRDHICAAHQKMYDADCISVHVRPNPQQVWQWTEWRKSSSSIVRNFVITEGGTDYTCPHEERYTGPVYTDCQAAYVSGERTSGMYTILPDVNTVMNVFCNHELEGGGWTVIQRRQDGGVDFYRTWDEYKVGFGDLAGEHWLGNENIHSLTKGRKQQVQIQLQTPDGESAVVKYTEFWTGNETEKYRLHIDGFIGDAIQGNSMALSNGMMFTTKDQDNDLASTTNCGVNAYAGWWYRACSHANLNGKYGSTTYQGALMWLTWKGRRYSMAYTAMNVKQVFIDCLDAYSNGMHGSGVYTIRPDGVTMMDAYCDMKHDGGGWTVIQRRQNGTVDFYRTWADYEVGFGDLEREHWLGNENIHLLTKKTSKQLKIHLKSLDGESEFADYSVFGVGDESQNYELDIKGYTGDTTPGDSMILMQNGQMFTTKDRDNDISATNCAETHHGAWWYGDCLQSNLNGLYGSTQEGEGLVWDSWKGTTHSMSYTAMMVRSVFIDCLDAYSKGMHESGVYTIRPDGITMMEAYCDMKHDGGGWTVIQRRQDGGVDFYRTWDEYKVGFGEDLAGEHWLGNENIHLLTKGHDSQVKVILQSLDGESTVADFHQFSIADESQGYELNIGNYAGDTIPGDSITTHSNGRMFTTKDQDNDGDSSQNWAVRSHGAWWYGGTQSANLNGDYGNTNVGEGLIWNTWKGPQHSMASTAIMVRKVPIDCQDAYNKGMHTSGIYTIRPDGITMTRVYCDQEHSGGGWTVIQRRQHGGVDFHRTWDEYKEGFGQNLAGEHWLGNENIHTLTKDHRQQVQIQLKTPDGESAFARYTEFWIGNETEKYNLHIQGYTGDATPGDSMALSNEMMFTTKDQDNDLASTVNCGAVSYGGWWYRACSHANLNGKYGSNIYYLGLVWHTWKGPRYSMAYTAVMVKPGN